MNTQLTYKPLVLQIALFALLGIYLINVFHQHVSSIAHTIAHQITNSSGQGHHLSDHHDAHHAHGNAHSTKNHHTHNQADQIHNPAKEHADLYNTENGKGHGHSHSFLALFKPKVLAEKVPSGKNVSLADLEFDKHLPVTLFSFYFPTTGYISHSARDLFYLPLPYEKIPTPPPQFLL